MLQTMRDHLVYFSGYCQGRVYSLPNSLGELYGLAISKVTSFVSLPLPLLSFLVLPFLGGSSTTINLVFFYLTWTSLVATHDPLTVELYGTLLVRLLFYLLPALGFLAFDSFVPAFSKGIKARGERQLPTQLHRNKLLEVVGVAVVNVLLPVVVQGGLELWTTHGMHLRSLLKVTTIVPLPWTIAKDVAWGLALRGGLRYAIHRFLLHTYASPLKTWHCQWQHSVELPFSLIAAYDHPVNHLLSQWLPVFLPAYLWRFHVLTWHILLAIVSLEDLFVYSGYAVLPSNIVLAGMARRTDAHFDTVFNGKRIGNFGHLGLLDFVCRTTCEDSVNVVDDMQSETEKHHLRQRAKDVVQSSQAGVRRGGDGQNKASRPLAGAMAVDEVLDDQLQETSPDIDRDHAQEKDADGDPTQQAQRTGRRKGRKT